MLAWQIIAQNNKELDHHRRESKFKIQEATKRTLSDNLTDAEVIRAERAVTSTRLATEKMKINKLLRQNTDVLCNAEV